MIGKVSINFWIAMRSGNIGTYSCMRRGTLGVIGWARFST